MFQSNSKYLNIEVKLCSILFPVVNRKNRFSAGYLGYIPAHDISNSPNIYHFLLRSSLYFNLRIVNYHEVVFIPVTPLPLHLKIILVFLAIWAGGKGCYRVLVLISGIIRNNNYWRRWQAEITPSKLWKILTKVLILAGYI